MAVIAAPGINLSPVNAVLDDPTTFEYVCIRISTGQFAAIIVVVYRPGSSAVQTTFFDELSSVLEVVMTFQEAVYVVGDFNVRLDRDDDPNTVQFTELLTCYGFSGHPTTATHNAGGTIDAIITCCNVSDSSDDSQVNVAVAEVGLYDHYLLTRPLPVCKILYRSVLSRVARDHRTLGSITTASKPSAALAALNVPIVRHVGGRLHSATPVCLLVLTMPRLPGTLNNSAIR